VKNINENAIKHDEQQDNKNNRSNSALISFKIENKNTLYLKVQFNFIKYIPDSVFFHH